MARNRSRRGRRAAGRARPSGNRALQGRVQRIARGIPVSHRRVRKDPPPLKSGGVRSGIVRYVVYHKNAPGTGSGYPGTPGALVTADNPPGTYIFLTSDTLAKAVYSQLLGWVPKTLVAGVMTINPISFTVVGGPQVSEVRALLSGRVDEYPPIPTSDVGSKLQNPAVKLSYPTPRWYDAATTPATNLLSYGWYYAAQTGTLTLPEIPTPGQIVVTIDIAVDYMLSGAILTPCATSVLTSIPSDAVDLKPVDPAEIAEQGQALKSNGRTGRR